MQRSHPTRTDASFPGDPYRHRRRPLGGERGVYPDLPERIPMHFGLDAGPALQRLRAMMDWIALAVVTCLALTEYVIYETAMGRNSGSRILLAVGQYVRPEGETRP